MHGTALDALDGGHTIGLLGGRRNSAHPHNRLEELLPDQRLAARTPANSFSSLPHD